MPVTFIGSQNIGKGEQKSARGKVAMAYAFNYVNLASDNAAGPQTIVVPGQGPTLDNRNASWYKFLIDPVVNQGSFDFGVAHALQIDITRYWSWIFSGTSYYLPGRVVVQIPSSGQFFCFSPKSLATVALFQPNVALNAGPAVCESTNDIVPIVLAQGHPLVLWMESDAYYATGAQQIGPPSTAVAVTLFNFQFQATGNI